MKIITLDKECLIDISGGNNLGKMGPENADTAKALQEMGKAIGSALEDAWDYVVGFWDGLWS